MSVGADLPGGTVTFLFTDIEGSTRLVRELRGVYADVRAVHCCLTRGGSGFVVSPHAADALTVGDTDGLSQVDVGNRR